MSDKTLPRQTLSEAELSVMKVIWSEPGLTVGEITKSFSETKKWKVQTVSTFLKRLTDKGYISCEKVKHAGRYSSRISEEEYGAMLAKSLIEENCNGSLKRLCALLCDTGSVSEKEIAELREWFDERYK